MSECVEARKLERGPGKYKKASRKLGEEGNRICGMKMERRALRQ